MTNAQDKGGAEEFKRHGDAFWLHLGKASLGAKPGMIGWIRNKPDVNGNGSDRFVGHLFGRGKVATLFVSGWDNLWEQERLQAATNWSGGGRWPY